MDIREIDDRYPEFARPYEPVGKGRRHKSLSWGFTSAFALVLAAALLAPSVAPIPVPEPAPQPPVVEPTPKPEPEPEPEPAPAPVPVVIVEPPAPEPATTIPAVTPTPTPAPTPAPAPTPTPTPTPTPVTPRYTVTFVDWDGTTISTAQYDEGTPAASIVSPSTPSRASDASYTYTFAGWTPGFADVTADATYAATYTAAPITYYSVTFVDYDGTTVLKAAMSYAEGTAASAIEQPATPTRAFDGTYNYTFSGWSPALAEVTADATYTAVYDSAKPKYTITWQNYDGSVIDTTTVEVGETPTHADPTYGPDAQHTYTFAGWSPAIAPVTGDATYTADYTLTLRQYDVTFVDWDGSVLEPTTAYDYGTAAYDMNVPSGVTRPADASYTYAFAGWSPTLAATVTADATYTATYTATPISYTAPGISILSEINYAGDSGNWVGSFMPNVYLRDAAGATGRIKLMRLNPDTGVWEEQVLGGDANIGTLMTSGTSFSDRALAVADPTVQYSIPDDATFLYGGMSWYFDYIGAWSVRERMKAAFDYTFPNGETGTTETDTFYLYKGGFVGRVYEYDAALGYEVAKQPVLDRDAKTITMEFVYNVNVGSDGFDPTIGSNTWWEHHLYWQDADAYDYSVKGTELSLTPTVAETTAGDGTKHVTVAYTLDSVPDNRAYYYEADLTYSDYGAKDHWNNWTCTAREYDMEFPAASGSHTAPLALRQVSSMSYGGDSEDYHVGFMVGCYNLNDAKGGKVAIRLQTLDEGTGEWVDPAGGFISYSDWEANDALAPGDPSKKLIYDAQTIWGVFVGNDDPDSDIEGEWIPGSAVTLDVDDPTQPFEVGDHDAINAIVMYHFPDEYWKGVRIAVRPVMDVVYPDGTTETVEGEPLYVYGGSFIEPNEDFGTFGMQIDKTNKTLTLEYVYETDVLDIDPANVRWVGDDEQLQICNSLFYATGYTGWWPPRPENWEDLHRIEITPTATERDEGGKHYVTLTYDLSGAPAEVWASPDNTYLFYMGDAHYSDESGEYFGIWTCNPDHGYIPVWQFTD